MRRVAAVVAIVIGVTLIGFTFAEHLFSRSRDAQKGRRPVRAADVGEGAARPEQLSDSQVKFASTFANADQIPLEPIPWMFIVPGLALALLAGLTLLPARRPADAPVQARTRVASPAG